MDEKMAKSLNLCKRDVKQIHSHKTVKQEDILCHSKRKGKDQYDTLKKNPLTKQFEKKEMKEEQLVKNGYYPGYGQDELSLPKKDERRFPYDRLVWVKRNPLRYAIGMDFIPKQILELSPFSLRKASYRTDRGERVRSEGEMLIANVLYKEKIPYSYEQVLMLKNGREVYPSFSISDPDDGERIYWQHFGRMDDRDGQAQAWNTINVYAANGIVAGFNLITSFEYKNSPLTTASIKEIVDRKLEHLKGLA